MQDEILWLVPAHCWMETPTNSNRTLSLLFCEKLSCKLSLCLFILPVSVKTNLVSSWSDSRPGGWREIGVLGGCTAAIGSSSGMGGSRTLDPGPGGSLGRDTAASLRASDRTSSAFLILTSRAEAHSLFDLQDDKMLVVLLQSVQHISQATLQFILHHLRSRVVPAYQHVRLCSTIQNWCPYPDAWLAFWQSAPSRSRCVELVMAKPVFRITDCTLYSLMTTLVPGTWNLRTWKGKQFQTIHVPSMFPPPAAGLRTYHTINKQCVSKGECSLGLVWLVTHHLAYGSGHLETQKTNQNP